MTSPSPTDKRPVPGHERRDVTFRPIVLATVGLVFALVVAVVGMRLLFEHLAQQAAQRSEPASPLATAAPRLPPEPRLQTAPIKDLYDLRAREQAQLDHYGWIDRDTGVVHIPITRAIDLLLERMPHAGAPAEPGR